MKSVGRMGCLVKDLSNIWTKVYWRETKPLAGSGARSHVLLCEMALLNLLIRRASDDGSGSAVNEIMQGVDLSRPLYHSRVFKQFRNEQGFNKRYFVLYPGFILYYKHERDYRNRLDGGMVGLTAWVRACATRSMGARPAASSPARRVVLHDLQKKTSAYVNAAMEVKWCAQLGFMILLLLRTRIPPLMTVTDYGLLW